MPDARPHPQGRPGDAARHRPTRRSTPPAGSIRGSWPKSAASSRPRPRSRRKGLPDDAGRAAPAQGDGLFRCAARQADRHFAEGGHAAPARARRAPGVQAHRHLRGRVRLADRLHVLDLRGPVRRRAGLRGGAVGRQKIIILGGGPNRIGQGIEFDYCCCHACLRAARGRLRDDHDQLQSGDGLDRLRHLGPPLFRAAHRRGRARDHRHRARTTARCTA